MEYDIAVSRGRLGAWHVRAALPWVVVEDDLVGDFGTPGDDGELVVADVYGTCHSLGPRTSS